MPNVVVEEPGPASPRGMLPPLRHVGGGGGRLSMGAGVGEGGGIADEHHRHARFRERLNSRELKRIDQLLDRTERRIPPRLALQPNADDSNDPGSTPHTAASTSLARSARDAMRAMRQRKRRQSKGAALAITYGDYRHSAVGQQSVLNASCNPFALTPRNRDLPQPPMRLPPVNVVIRQFHDEKRDERRKHREELRKTRPPPPRPPAHTFLQKMIVNDYNNEPESLELQVKYAVAELTSYYYWVENKAQQRPPTFYSYALAVFFCKREFLRLRRRQIRTLFSLLTRGNYQGTERSIPWVKAKKLMEGFRALDTRNQGVLTMRCFNQAANRMAGTPIAPMFFRRLDKDRSGDISFSELLRATFPAAKERVVTSVLDAVASGRACQYSGVMNERYSVRALHDIATLFRHFTRSGEVRLHFPRFKECAPGDICDEDLAKQFREADTNGDGRLDFIEFAGWTQSVGVDEGLSSSHGPGGS